MCLALFSSKGEGLQYTRVRERGGEWVWVPGPLRSVFLLFTTLFGFSQRRSCRVGLTVLMVVAERKAHTKRRTGKKEEEKENRTKHVFVCVRVCLCVRFCVFAMKQAISVIPEWVQATNHVQTQEHSTHSHTHVQREKTQCRSRSSRSKRKMGTTTPPLLCVPSLYPVPQTRGIPYLKYACEVFPLR